jgi:hypothetical protein
VSPASRPVLAAAISASLALSVALSAAAPAVAGDTRPPELAFAGELLVPGQTELDHLILVVDEVTDPTSIPDRTDFEIVVDGVPQAPVSVELSYEGFAGPDAFFADAGASFLRLGLATPGIDLGAIHYLPGGHPIRDLALNEMAEVSVTPEAITVDGMAFAGATVDYQNGTDRILLLFAEALDLNSIPVASDFAVTVNGTPTAVTVQTPMTNVGPGFINLVLPSPMHLSGSEALSVTYTPGAHPILGRITGGEAGPFAVSDISYFLPLNTTGGTVAPGGLVTTFYGTGPTVSDPLATTVQSPTGGAVSITEQPIIDETNAGYTFFGQQVLITAPDAADAAHPLLFTFDLHQTLVPEGENAQSLAILRNDVPVGRCDAIAPAPAVASPTPCVWQRIDHPDGSVTITVATIQASRWNFGRANPIAFSGFGAPVDRAPVRNGMKAGSAVPLKFSLGGNRGLGIFAPGSPSSQAVTCNTSVPLDDVEQTVTAGASSLSYNAAIDSYSYTWKTQKTWTGCRKLTLTFTDGSVQEAIFQFKP